MRHKKFMAVVLVFAAAIAMAGPRGTAPRASADKYASHAEQGGASIGATLLSSGQAHKAFTTDLERCCMAVELALYPPKDGMVEVSLDEFALRIVGQDIASKPSSGEVIAAKLQHKANSDDGRDVVIAPIAGIGYETGGIDPVTGQPRRGGVITSTGVGVGMGGPHPPKPASSDADRRTMELELREKGLPEGNTISPVAGYIYFSVQRKKNMKYQLEYMLNGNKIILPL